MLGIWTLWEASQVRVWTIGAMVALGVPVFVSIEDHLPAGRCQSSALPRGPSISNDLRNLRHIPEFSHIVLSGIMSVLDGTRVPNSK